MNTYNYRGMEIDSVELKCLLVSRGVKVSQAVYQHFSKTHRLGVNPLMCNCMTLPDGTMVQLTDMGFHLKYLTGILSWDNLKLLKYASVLKTPFSIRMDGEEAAVFDEDRFICHVGFPPKSGFYMQKTASGLPFLGNAVLQGVDWVAFQCLWPCEYGAAGKSCQFCFSGAEHETLVKKHKPLPCAVPPDDVADIVEYAIEHAGCNSIQLTGGSTFNPNKEYRYISAYLDAIMRRVGRENIRGDILLYITPPQDKTVIDEYFAMGADRIACSLEVWDEKLAAEVTPGKVTITTRQRHLEALEYIVEKHGPGKAFSNFVIGVEPFESLKEGAEYLAARGVIPTASIWMPMGRPVAGSMTPPDAAYYRKVKELFAGLYQQYGLEPSECCGLNVCMERDIWNFSCTA